MTKKKPYQKKRPCNKCVVGLYRGETKVAQIGHVNYIAEKNFMNIEGKVEPISFTFKKLIHSCVSKAC